MFSFSLSSIWYVDFVSCIPLNFIYTTLLVHSRKRDSEWVGGCERVVVMSCGAQCIYLYEVKSASAIERREKKLFMFWRKQLVSGHAMLEEINNYTFACVNIISGTYTHTHTHNTRYKMETTTVFHTVELSKFY